MAAGSEPRCWSPRAEKRVRRFSAPPPPQSIPPLRCAPLSLWSPQTRLLPRVSAIRAVEFPDCPNRPAPPAPPRRGLRDIWARSELTAPQHLPVQNFPTRGCLGGRAPAPTSVRSRRAIANPGSLSGRGPRRVAGTEPKSQKRGPHRFRGEGKAMGAPLRNPFPRRALSAGKAQRDTFPRILSVEGASWGAHSAPTSQARKRESWQRKRTPRRGMA